MYASHGFYTCFQHVCIFTSKFACPCLCRPIVWPVWEELSFQLLAELSKHKIYTLKSGNRRQVIFQVEPGQGDMASRPSKTCTSMAFMACFPWVSCSFWMVLCLPFWIIPAFGWRHPFSDTHTDKAKTPKKTQKLRHWGEYASAQGSFTLVAAQIIRLEDGSHCHPGTGRTGSRDSGRWSWHILTKKFWTKWIGAYDTKRYKT